MRRRTWGGLLLLLALMISGIGCDDDDDDLMIITAALPDGRVGIVYNFNIEVEGDDDEFLIVDGTLPPGISLSGDGKLSGVPTIAGTFFFTVEVLDLFRGFIAERDARGFAIVIEE
jgi:hypothetical protein